jgi:putative heme-binding domain-containing protein
MDSAEAGTTVAEFITAEDSPPELVEKAFARLNHQLFSQWTDLRKSPAVVAAVKKALKTPELQAQALELTDDLEDPVYGSELLAVAKSKSAPEEVRGTAIQALGKTHDAAYLPELDKLAQNGPLALRVVAVRAMGYAKPRGLESKFKTIVLSDAPNEIRAEAVRVLGRSDQGCNLLLDLEQAGELPSELRNVATIVTNANRKPAIKARAERLLPAFTSKNKTPLPPIGDLVWLEGNPENGRKVFGDTAGPKCKTCHKLGQGKKSVGPDLSAIGSKLGKQALFESILNPSAGIAPEYYVWILQTKSQGEVIGIITEDTPQRVTVRTDTGDEFRFKPVDITSRRRSRLSLMPEDLVKTMTKQQLVDVVAFLTTLKEDHRTAKAADVR